MATLYIDRRNLELELEGDTLVCRDREGRRATLPLAPIERLYLRSGVRLSSGLLAALGRRDIALVVLQGRKGTPVLFHPRPHRDARLRCAQYRLLQDGRMRCLLARLIIGSKIRGQQAQLEALAPRRPRHRRPLLKRAELLARMANQVPHKETIDRLRGVEGAAAHHYFAAWKEMLPDGLKFEGRNRRPPRDPVNAALSLGYTLLHAETVIATYGHGFDPFIGFYHELDFGRESLACDMVEPLRAEIDAMVLDLFMRRELRPENFSRTPEGCVMGKAGRQRFYLAFERTLERLRRRLDEMLSALADVLLERMSITECDRAWKAGPYASDGGPAPSDTAAGADEGDDIGNGEDGRADAL